MCGENPDATEHIEVTNRNFDDPLPGKSKTLLVELQDVPEHVQLDP